VKNVTEVFDHYRMSARSVWNTAFWPDAEFRNWDSVERFGEIERILFDELVLVKLNRTFPADRLFSEPIPFFRVVPSSALARIMIQQPRPNAPTGYWDDPVDRVPQNRAEMHFLAFFDWNALDYRDLQYYRVSIAAFDEQPHLVGREALIERQYVNVFLADA
jgi:hypothetical protein